MKNCFLFHEWDKWIQFQKIFNVVEWKRGMKAPITMQTAEDWQKRTCLKCNKTEQKKI